MSRYVTCTAVLALALAGCSGAGSTTSESVTGGAPVRSMTPTTVVTRTVTASPTTAATSPAPTTDAQSPVPSSQAPTSSAGAPAADTPEPSAPATTPAASPSTSVALGSAAPAPKGSASAPEKPSSSPEAPAALQTEPGGTIALNGTSVGRGSGGTSPFLKRLGAPSATGTCTSDGTPFQRLTYGSLTLFLPKAPVKGMYGDTYPVGEIAGWTLTGTSAGNGIAVAGPEGTAPGTTLATLKKRFTVGQWDYADVERDHKPAHFNIFAGDTTGASFALDANDRVTSMSGGATCD